MLVMSFLFLLVLLLDLAVFGSAQSVATAITLWQFGQGRLLSASVTLPLIPLGTETINGGAQTTFLYQALNPSQAITTDANGVTFATTIPVPTPRTLVASASGWNEGAIACALINPTFGDCVDTGPTGPGTTHNSGPAITEVLAISAETPIITPPPTTSPFVVPSNSDPTKSSSVTGAIVGGVIGGLALFLGLGAFLFVLWRRPRHRAQTAPPVPPKTTFDRGPGLEAGFVTTERPILAIVPPRKGLLYGGSAGVDVESYVRSAVTMDVQSPSTDQLASPSNASVSMILSPVPSSTLEGQMTEISHRLKALEARNGVPEEDPAPPPSYGESSY
ncbi:hypothetical protein FB45DRAFT_910399 [Roridomyces roridus]|uniref:Mid2 domain-containing protein n=1 Tax=Roridomyces roridus TaxID=1738132 RepID=A0AAD7BZM7_9AGAR|nr:hypothetical protein FB45DRAFT_910399 [Roridomyces roridus]